MTGQIDGKFLIVGTGRSGTGYMAEVLTESGLETGHEKVYNPQSLRYVESGIHDFPYWPKNGFGDSSWMAVPYLGRFLEAGGKAVHITRHPYDVLASLVGIGFLSMIGLHAPYETFANYHMSHITGDFKTTRNRGEIILRNAEFIDQWLAKIGRFDLPTYKIEEMDEISLKKIFTDVGYLGSWSVIDALKAQNNIPTNVNARPRAIVRPLERPAIIDELASEWGYATIYG